MPTSPDKAVTTPGSGGASAHQHGERLTVSILARHGEETDKICAGRGFVLRAKLPRGYKWESLGFPSPSFRPASIQQTVDLPSIRKRSWLRMTFLNFEENPQDAKVVIAIHLGTRSGQCATCWRPESLCKCSTPCVTLSKTRNVGNRGDEMHLHIRTVSNSVRRQSTTAPSLLAKVVVYHRQPVTNSDDSEPQWRYEQIFSGRSEEVTLHSRNYGNASTWSSAHTTPVACTRRSNRMRTAPKREGYDSGSISETISPRPSFSAYDAYAAYTASEDSPQDSLSDAQGIKELPPLPCSMSQNDLPVKSTAVVTAASATPDSTPCPKDQQQHQTPSNIQQSSAAPGYHARYPAGMTPAMSGVAMQPQVVYQAPGWPQAPVVQQPMMMMPAMYASYPMQPMMMMCPAAPAQYVPTWQPQAVAVPQPKTCPPEQPPPAHAL